MVSRNCQHLQNSFFHVWSNTRKIKIHDISNFAIDVESGFQLVDSQFIMRKLNDKIDGKELFQSYLTANERACQTGGSMNRGSRTEQDSGR